VPGEDKAQMMSCTKIWYVLTVSFNAVLMCWFLFSQGPIAIHGEVP
jgi:hypothetical protein